VNKVTLACGLIPVGLSRTVCKPYSPQQAVLLGKQQQQQQQLVPPLDAMRCRLRQHPKTAAANVASRSAAADVTVLTTR